MPERDVPVRGIGASGRTRIERSASTGGGDRLVSGCPCAARVQFRAPHIGARSLTYQQERTADRVVGEPKTIVGARRRRHESGCDYVAESRDFSAIRPTLVPHRHVTVGCSVVAKFADVCRLGVIEDVVTQDVSAGVHDTDARGSARGLEAGIENTELIPARIPGDVWIARADARLADLERSPDDLTAGADARAPDQVIERSERNQEHLAGWRIRYRRTRLPKCGPARNHALCCDQAIGISHDTEVDEVARPEILVPGDQEAAKSSGSVRDMGAVDDARIMRKTIGRID